jgi:hypothetical protein
MYDEKVLHKIMHQIKVTILVGSVLFILSLVLSIMIASAFSNNLGMLLLIAGISLCIFIWGIYGTPVLNYYNFVKNMITGRSRTIDGKVKKIGVTPVYKDNKLYFYEVLIDESGEERLLLNDINTPVEGIRENQRYLFDIHENYIKNVLFKG